MDSTYDPHQVGINRTTKADETFKRRVAEEFAQARDRAKRDGWSVEEFVAKLGITRAALHKYLHRTAIPSLRVLERARKFWGVKLSYGELEDSYVRTKSKDPRQLEFQFSLSEISAEQIQIRRFTAKSESTAELVIRIDFGKGA
jgi:transcriptional regulator with XRE-family HTH domain